MPINTDTKITIVESLSDLTDELIAQWRALEDNSLEGNIYASADFIIPALRHLTPEKKPLIIFIQADNKLIFVSVFQKELRCIRKPFHSISSYHSTHSLLSGFLVEKNLAELGLSELFKFIRTNKKHWKAIELQLHMDESEQSKLMKTKAKEYGFLWLETHNQIRATLIPENYSGTTPALSASKSLLKNIRKNKKELAELGSLEYRYIDKPEDISTAIEVFLSLEHCGWKGSKGTSLLAHENHATFFREMTVNLAKRGKVFFTEVLLSGNTIASTINYISGDSGFAFKLGRDENFNKYSIGVINELFLLEKIPEKLSNIKFFDSGSVSGSYMEKLWQEKCLLTSGYLTSNTWIYSYLKVINTGGKIYRHIRNRIFFKTIPSTH